MTAHKAAPKRKPARPAPKRKAAPAVKRKGAAKPTPATKAKPAAKPKPARRKTPARPKRTAAAKAPGRQKRVANMRPNMPPDYAIAVAAVERDLKRMPADVAKSAEAATALAMASRLDSGDGSPSECAKALLAAMGKLREMTPPEERKGQLHAIRSGRADRLAEGSTAGKG